MTGAEQLEGIGRTCICQEILLGRKKDDTPNNMGESRRLCIEFKKLNSKREIVRFYSLCITF